MPRVTILPVDLAATVAVGDSLLDAGERAGVEMVAGCFNCSCGTCVVAVLRGWEHLMPSTPRELEVLRGAGFDPSCHRLACSARLANGDVTIRQLD
jgi:ferredoxin